MSNISRVSLFAKLNPIAFKSVEGATVLCKLRGNPYVQLVHWVAQILHQDDSDWHHILRHFELDAGAVLADVQRALERQPSGAQGISDLSESITNAVERAWGLRLADVWRPEGAHGSCFGGFAENRFSVAGIAENFASLQTDS